MNETKDYPWVCTVCQTSVFESHNCGHGAVPMFQSRRSVPRPTEEPKGRIRVRVVPAPDIDAYNFYVLWQTKEALSRCLTKEKGEYRWPAYTRGGAITPLFCALSCDAKEAQLVREATESWLASQIVAGDGLLSNGPNGDIIDYIVREVAHLPIEVVTP